MHTAKEAAQKFLHRDHQHDTEVRESFAPAVTKETIVPIKKVEEVVAVDREVHVDHFQTRIQPIEDVVKAPEKHEVYVAPVEHRERKLGNHEHVHKRLQDETAQLRDTVNVLPTQEEKIEGGVLQAEHVHHHVYERVQPVIEREVIQPTVVHATIPVHEKIIHEPTIHPPTVQPKMTMEDFRKAGGVLEGKPEVRDVFAGEPVVRENGGAHETHPNVHREGGLIGGGHHHNSTSSTTHRDGRVVENEHGRRGLRSDSSSPAVGAY
jgi:hypothetical protein